jgi:hypothetical protein
MPGFLFTNPWMLAGLSALAVPVLIHLLLKKRMRRLRFSTIQFFQKQDEQSSRRRKLRNWLLLALRLLIVTLLVLSFARPFVRQNQATAAGHQPRQVVFVLDRSASMLASNNEGERWALARSRAQKLLGAMDAGDRAALVACGTHAEVLSGFAPPETVAKVLGWLQPGFGTSSLAEGLQQALRLLAGRGAGAATTLYLVSDFQNSACRNLSACGVPDEIEVKLVPVGDLHSANTAVTRLELDPATRKPPQVSIANFSEEDSAGAAVEFRVDGQVTQAQPVGLKAGGLTNIEWTLPALKPGWHNLQAGIKSRDALELDNVRFGCVFVPEPIQVLLAQPRTSKRVFERETFFLESALDPAAESTNATASGLSVRQAAPEELGRQLSGSPGQPGPDLVILPGLKEVPAGVGQALAAFVQGGGGLLLFVGDGVSANRYHGEFRDLLPARLGDVEVEPEVGGGWRIADYDTNALAFAVFRLPGSGDLRIPEFTKRFALTLNREASRLASFDDGVPLLATRSLGQGRVALVNASADTAWDDWPKHKTFVPWLHGLARYLARKNNRDQASGLVQFVAGEDIDLEAGPALRKAQLKLATPGARELAVSSDERGVVRDVAAGPPGIYVLKDQRGQELRRFALNLPNPESDLEAMRPADFLQQLVRVHETPQASLLAGFFGATNHQRDLWRALLLALLVLLVIEPLLANRTSA